MMNLENLYGTQESLLRAFERAVQRNNPKDVFFQLSRIYINSDKHDVSFTKYALYMILYIAKSRVIAFTTVLHLSCIAMRLYEV